MAPLCIWDWALYQRAWPGSYRGIGNCQTVSITDLALNWDSKVTLVVKNLPANARDIRGRSLIPGWGRSPGGRYTIHSSIHAWLIPWTEEPGGLQTMGLQRVVIQLKWLSMHITIMAQTNMNQIISVQVNKIMPSFSLFCKHLRKQKLSHYFWASFANLFSLMTL